VKARKVKKLDPQAPLAANAARIVRVRLDELRSLAPNALLEGSSTEQHDLRIAAKRLRYILEATEFCFGKAGPAARRGAKDLQQVLGELHDCDEMLPRVEHHLADRRGDRGLEELAAHLEARRLLLFERFSELWAEQGRKGTWDALERATARW
jgi:CHAD domain-containing protein